jgi:integration host factor subunit beta
MTKSEFIEWLSQQQTHFDHNDVDQAVDIVLRSIAEALAVGQRVEIRSFGSFSLHYRPGRIGRNPKSGELVSIPARYVPYFKPGKRLREAVNDVQVSAYPNASQPDKAEIENA